MRRESFRNTMAEISIYSIYSDLLCCATVEVCGDEKSFFVLFPCLRTPMAKIQNEIRVCDIECIRTFGNSINCEISSYLYSESRLPCTKCV